MVKKKSTAKKAKKISLITLKTSTFNYNLFKSKIPAKTLWLYVAINILVVAAINTIRSNMSYSALSPFESFIYTNVGILVIGLAIFAPFYIFLSAFEGKLQKFWHSYGIFLAISMPFLVLGHILDWLRASFFNLGSFFTSLIIILLIYYIFNLIWQLKTYFNTTKLRILASFILVDIIIGTIAILQYMSYVILTLG